MAISSAISPHWIYIYNPEDAQLYGILLLVFIVADVLEFIGKMNK
jgi:hypothetical protein